MPPSETDSETLLTAFPPVSDACARILILGSMPGVASLDAQRYYAHPQNAFWPVISSILRDDPALLDAKPHFGASPVDSVYRQATQMVIDRNIAIWDVLKHCRRPGSLDSNIRQDSAVCNDLETFLQAHPDVYKILFNGKAAQRLFERTALPQLSMSDQLELIPLPSTSPAMAGLSRAEKRTHWAAALNITI